MAKKIIRSAKHLAFVRTLSCVKTGLKPCEAAHIRKGTDGGIGMKPSDCWTLPLSSAAHRDQHQIGEVRFYTNLTRARELAQAIWNNSGDTEYCESLIKRYRREIF